MSALYLPARAKLNLMLRVVGRRADGYHLLETLYHEVDWHDDLWLAPAPAGIALEVTADSARSAAPRGPDNLVVKALAALTEAAGGGGFRVRLHKRIPAGGGLGGGSSDAAAALRLGNAALGGPLDDDALIALARRLGADVPFFVRGGSQWGRGVGDELLPAAVPARHFVLVVPPFDCPTAEVYKIRAAHWNDGGAQGTNIGASVPHTWEGALRIGFNDLERAAEVVRPALAALRRRVAELGRVSVHVTGSGSTLYVDCADEDAAVRCERDLRPLAAEGVGIVRTRSAGPRGSPTNAAWPDDPGPEPGRGPA